jgi:hypothetical protein
MKKHLMSAKLSKYNITEVCIAQYLIEPHLIPESSLGRYIVGL